MSPIGASNEHKLLDEVLLALFVHVNTFGFKLNESTIYNLNATFYDESSGVNFSLGLLYKEKTLCDFGMVGHLHDFHSFDFDSTNVASIL